MGTTSTIINGAYNVTSIANGIVNGYWTWTGTNMDSSGTNVYDADGEPTNFTVNISVVPLPGGTATIAFQQQGVGTGCMAQFANFPNSSYNATIPRCMWNFVLQSSTQFTFTNSNPSYTDENEYFLLLGVTVTATSAAGDSGTTSFYSPDPIIINKDPDGPWWIKTPEPQPQLTAARA